jgi:CRP-like cAMP-binding protein
MRMENRLVHRLPRVERDALERAGERIELALDSVLCESGEAYRDAHFPLTGFISVLGEGSGHPPLEVGLIGSEGMLGATLALGVDIAPHRAVVHGAGTALRVPLDRMKLVLLASPSLLVALHRYLYTVFAEVAQTAVCTCFHDAEARLVRWLLLTHDRVSGDEFSLTHQRLADMLGLQRSAVTIAAGELQKRELIRYTRGEISILDRDGLEAACCECYAGAAVRARRAN